MMTMSQAEIIAEMQSQIERHEAAIAGLRDAIDALMVTTPKKRRWSPEQRRRRSEAMKILWAKRNALLQRAA
jgi:hypothetical protein